MKQFELPPGYDAEVLYTPAAASLREEGCCDLSLFISCYNESEFIVTTLDRVLSALWELDNLSYELIIVDDCSIDDSIAVLREFISCHPNEPLILRCNQRNRGLSQNYVDMAFFAIGKYYRLVCGDTAESTTAMKAIYSAISAADIIIPFYPRSVSGKRRMRKMISATYVTVINLLAGQTIKYYNGLPLHRRFHVMRWHPTTRGFGFQADILCMLLEQGYSFKEIPVEVVDRKPLGGSALKLSNFFSVAHTLINIIIRRLARRVHEG
jgi:dolichol-phosphate mannosyltransferase